MYAGQFVFAQVVDFLPLHKFRKCVERYQGDYKTQSFSCFDQFLCLAFAQLTYRESLRDIETCLISTPGITIGSPSSTNNFALAPLTIAQLHKACWRVELFFKWIKQHLRIKAFYGTSENAVRTQIWIAVFVYVLVAILKKRLDLGLSLYKILQILSITAFEKTRFYKCFLAQTTRLTSPIPISN